MTTGNVGRTRGRPRGSYKEQRRQRKDHRFAPDTLSQIKQGQALLPSPPITETAFLERAVGHYLEFLLTGNMQQQSNQQELEQLRDQLCDLEQEKQRLQDKNLRMENDLRSTKTTLKATQTALRLAEEKKISGPAQSTTALRKRPSSHEPLITIDSLAPKGNMGGYWLRWEQDGLCMHVGLEAVNDYSSVYGYRLEWYGSNPARKNLALGQRQQEHVFSFLAPARARLVEELLKAGWQPEDPTKPEDPTTIWKYRPQEGGKQEDSH